MEWWVVNQVSRPGGARGPQSTNYVVVQATNRPTNAVAGPFQTKADAENWQTGANTAGNSPGSVTGGVTDALAKATGIDAIGTFFNDLEQGNTWLRIAEGALGIILIAVALAKLTGADNVIAKTATTAAKAAVL
jgi:hypothetical protein